MSIGALSSHPQPPITKQPEKIPNTSIDAIIEEIQKLGGHGKITVYSKAVTKTEPVGKPSDVQKVFDSCVMNLNREYQQMYRNTMPSSIGVEFRPQNNEHPANNEQPVIMWGLSAEVHMLGYIGQKTGDEHDRLKWHDKQDLSSRSCRS